MSRVIIFDSTNNHPKDYTRLRQVLDEALLNFDTTGGNIEVKKHEKITGALRFGYYIECPCLQQADGSEEDMHYVASHMMEFMRLNNTFKRGTDVTAWGSNLLKLKEDVLKKEFKCIQVSLARIINKDVYSPAGVFHGGFDETPAEVEDRLRKQGDKRSFNMLGSIRCTRK